MKKSIFLLAALCTIGIKANAQYISTFAGTGGSGYTGDGGPAISAQITDPAFVASDGSGNIYFTADNVVRKVNSVGLITTIAGNTSSGHTGDGGPATAALTGSSGIVVDASGNIYIGADYCVRKIDGSTGIISMYAGTAVSGYSGDGGQATAAQVSQVQGLAIDGSGNLYITDENNECIRKVDASGIITTIAGNTTAGYSGDGGQATAAELNRPVDVKLDATGNIYISDQVNNVVRMVNTSGVISTFAGNGTAGYYGDGGPATAAELNSPYGLAVDGSGNIFVADLYNDVIREINTSGVISTAVATGTSGFSGDCGMATAAEIDAPNGLWVDASGNLYIADNNNFRVREVSTSSPLPNAGTITGTATFCQGSASTLVDATGYVGGTWSSSNTTVATVDATGIVTGVSGGSCTITYSVTNACGTAYTTYSITINPLPNAGAITGTSTFCQGSTSALTDATGDPGGTWISSNTTIATVDPTGLVTGVSGGSCTITYSVTNGCGTAYATYGITINPLPNPGTITGITPFCESINTSVEPNWIPYGGVTTSQTLTSSGDPGGTWASSDVTNFTIDASSGVLAGIYHAISTSSATTITYTVTNGCGTAYTTLAMKKLGVPTITTTPDPCTGVAYVYSPSPWVTGSLSSWTVLCGTCGIVTSLTGVHGTDGDFSATVAGTHVAIFTYTFAGSASTCRGQSIENLNTVIPPNPGIISITAGTVPISTLPLVTVTLGSSVAGGAWSTASSLANVSSGGVVSRVSGALAGTAVITYTVTNSSCSNSATYSVSVAGHRDANNGGSSTIENEGSEHNYTFAPNPTDGNITVSQSAPVDEAVNYRVTNALGTTVYQGQLQFNGGKSQFTLENVASGMYMVELMDNYGAKYIAKIIVSK